jgi:hypothetical protein
VFRGRIKHSVTEAYLGESPAGKVTFKNKEEDNKDEACFDAQLGLIANGTKDCSSMYLPDPSAAKTQLSELCLP